jgi:carbamoyl-phosphate synthase large subunit
VDSERPVLVDKYLDRADELDVDALCDKDGNVVITGIMQHIEQVCGLNEVLSAGCSCLVQQGLLQAGIAQACRTCTGDQPLEICVGNLMSLN